MNNQFNKENDPQITWSSSLKMPFVVPEGYFDYFSTYLMTEINTKSDHWVKKLPYQQPDASYFENLASHALQQAKLESLKSDKKDLNVGEVPSQYFENLSAQILSKVKGEVVTEDLEATTFDAKTMPYKVPEGYFEANPARFTPTKEKKKAKTIPMPTQPVHQPLGRQWLWLAASIALFMGLFGYKNWDKMTSKEVHDMEYFENQLAMIPYEDIEEYLGIYDEGIELNFSSKEAEDRFLEGLNALSLDDIEFYLSE